MLKRLLSLLRSVPVTVPATRRSPAAGSSLVRAARGGPVLTEVGSLPPGFDPATFGEMAAEAMASAMTGLVVRFTTDPAAAPHPRIRVEITVDRTSDHGRVKVTATFSDGAEILASAEGWTAAGSASDPTLPRLLRQLAHTLFDDEIRW